MVLSAVFIPMASSVAQQGQFIDSSLSLLFQHGAFSTGCADSHPRVMCNIAEPVSAEHHENKGGFFGWFNTPSIIALITTPIALAKSSVPQAIFTDLCADCCRNGGVVFTLPSSFLPEEDQGVFLTMIQLPLARRKSGRKKCWIK